MEWTVTVFGLYFICTFDVNVILIVIVIMIENTFCLVNHHSMKIPITVKYFFVTSVFVCVTEKYYYYLHDTTTATHLPRL